MSLFFRNTTRTFLRYPCVTRITPVPFFQPMRFMGAVVEPPSPDEISSRIIDTIKNYEKVDPSKVTRTSHFVKDLGLDSLDTVELVLAFEDEFCIEIPEEVADNISSVPDVLSYLVTNPHVK